jgi:hypothetical protein
MDILDEVWMAVLLEGFGSGVVADDIVVRGVRVGAEVVLDKIPSLVC